MDRHLFELFDQGADRVNTQCEKWDDRQEVFGREDVIPLWVADMDFHCPEGVGKALVKRAQHNVFGYCKHDPGNQEAVARWMNTRHGARVEPEWVLTSPGVVDSLALSVRLMAKPGEQVVIQPPVYGPFFSVVEQSGCQLRRNRLIDTPEGYRMDFEDLEHAFQEGARLMILCNPHNPVGRVWRQQEMDQLVQLVNRYGVTLVSDEIHSDFIYPGFEHHSVAARDDLERAIVCVSATKSFNLAALRISSVIIRNPELRAQFAQGLHASGMGGNLMGEVAQRAAYETGAAWMDGLVAYLDGTRKLVLEALARDFPEVSAHAPEGTYLMWLDFRRLGMDAKELASFMVHEAGIGFSGGTGFGVEGEGFMRMNIATPRRNVEQALRQLRSALDRR